MKNCVPDIYQKSIYLVDYSKLMSSGITTLLFDLDNTILNPIMREIPLKTKNLFISLKQKGFKIIIFSNSPRRKVNKCKEYLGVDGVYFALKPLSKSFKKVMENYELSASQIAIIGDQLLTDVFGGNRMGIKTILVNPIDVDNSIFTFFNRIIEKIILKKLAKKNLFIRGRYYE